MNLIDPDGHSWISKIFKGINNFLKDAFSDIERGLEKVTNSQWTFDVNIEVRQKHQVDNVGEVGFGLLTQPWQIGIGVLRWAHEPRFKILAKTYSGSYEETAIDDWDNLFINGINNNIDYAFANAEKVYKFKAFKVVYNPTDSTLADLTESIFQKLFFTSSFDRQLARAFEGHSGITLAGHSQGAIILSNVLINLGLRDLRDVVQSAIFHNTQVSQPRAYLSAALAGINAPFVTYGSRYFDFSNALGPNLEPAKFMSGIVGLTYLPLGMKHHGLEL